MPVLSRLHCHHFHAVYPHKEPPLPTRLVLNESSGRPQTILEVGAEGGSITLFRVELTDGQSQFGVATNESLLYDEDLGQDDFAPARPAYADSFLAAVDLLDKYPWVNLYPLEVHPAYLGDVLREVKKRGGSIAERRWREEIAQQPS